MQTFPTLYKRDSKGQIREWHMEVDGDKYRTVAGLQDGQKVTSEWTVAEAKNVGRANATTAEEQAVSEVESQYTKKLDVDYHRDEADVDTPKIFKPMLAQPWEKRQAKIDYEKDVVWVQPKLDGIRCIATRHGLFSRTGKPIVAVPHIFEALQPAFRKNPDAVFDGELYNHELKHDFNDIVSMVRKTKVKPEDIELSAKMVEYHVYDYPYMMHDNFSTRMESMISLLLTTGVSYVTGGDSCIVFVPTMKCVNEAKVDAHYGKFMADGYEGGIVRIEGPYEQKRSNLLVKRKDFEDAEFEIVRIEEGLGNWSGMAKRVVFKNDLDGREVGAGLKGSQDFARQLLQEADEYVGKQVTIQFFTRTPDGVPRFPIAKVLHKEARW